MFFPITQRACIESHILHRKYIGNGECTRIGIETGSIAIIIIDTATDWCIKAEVLELLLIRKEDISISRKFTLFIIAVTAIGSGSSSIHTAGCQLAITARDGHLLNHNEIFNAGFSCGHWSRETSRTGTDNQQVGFFYFYGFQSFIFWQIVCEFSLQTAYTLLHLVQRREIVAVSAISYAGYMARVTSCTLHLADVALMRIRTLGACLCPHLL